MKIAAAYIRVSTDDQIEYSPDSQVKAIRDYAKKVGYVVPDEFIFVDEGISGRHTNKRTAFNRMIATAKLDPKPFDAILLWKFSRFARNREDAIVYKSMLRNKRGIDVISITETVDDDKMSILIEAMIEAMDEYYSVNLGEEVKRGMTEKASRGEPLCIAPFGYDLVDKMYVINEDEAAIVRDIFHSFLSGEGMRSIASRLTNQGVKTKRGNFFDNRQIEYMLNNPVYAGKIRWSPDGKLASKRDYDNETFMIIDGKHEAIIDSNTYEKVYAKLHEEKRQYKRYQRKEQPVEWMLKGLLRCSACGATLTYTNRKCASVQCYKYARGQCTTSHSLAISKANEAVIRELQNCLISRNFNVVPPPKRKIESQVDLDKLLESETRKLTKIKDAYQAGIDTLDEYRENKTRITENIDAIKAEIKKRDEVTVIDTSSLINKVGNVLKTITDCRNSEAAKNAILRTVVEKIVFDKANQRLILFFYV